MSPFTDDDLYMIHKQLQGVEKSGGSLPLGEIVIPIGYTELKGLIARLELAEAALTTQCDCNDNYLTAINPCPEDIAIEVWRKVAGK